MGQATDQEIKEALERKGHYALNWEDLDKIEPPTGVISSMYRVGDPTRAESPTVFKVFIRLAARSRRTPTTVTTPKSFWKGLSGWVPPGITPATFASASNWVWAAGRGAEGTTVLFMFATGAWPAIKLGNNDGSTLGSEILEAHLKRCRRARTVRQRGGNDS